MAAVTKPEREADEALERLLATAWKRIAASGWNRYQLYGRGALLASTGMLDGTSDGMDYVSLSASAPLPKWLESAISGYDPRTSVVLVFVEDEVFRRASRPAGAELLAEHMGILSGLAYCRVVVRTPPPPECAKSVAN